jgi:GTP-binding protein
MTIGVNTSPLAGRDVAAPGERSSAARQTKITARLVSARLDRELVGNVSMRVLPTHRPDTWEVQGRGELALAVLVETMRREGYELTVGRPQVITREIGGQVHEPVERLTVDVPEEFFGAVSQLLAVRKGRLEQMTNHGSGWVRLEFVVPARGLIGFRTEFLTDTRGTGVAHHVFDGYQPWFGDLRTRPSGSLVADRAGTATPYAMYGLQERGSLFVPPGTEVYEGMIVGENSRPGDMDVNICRERKLTNVRQSAGEELERLVPPRLLSLEQALEFCADDECVEVTPSAIRLRKAVLDARQRERMRARRARASQ